MDPLSLLDKYSSFVQVDSELFLKSFSGLLPEKVQRIDSLAPFHHHESSIFVHLDSGVTSSQLQMNPVEAANHWTDNVFGVSGESSYTSRLPFAKARLTDPRAATSL